MAKTPKKPKKPTTAKKIKEVKAEIVPLDEGIEGEVIDNTGHDRFGRPRAVTEDCKLKLKEAFSFGCSNKEAALHANIAESTLYLYFKEDPEFKDFCDQLKQKPVLYARMTLIEAVKKNPFYALKLLERVKSDEFSLRIRQTLTEPDDITDEEQELIDNLIEANLS